MHELSKEMLEEIRAKGLEFSWRYSGDEFGNPMSAAWKAGARVYALRAVKAEAMLEIALKGLRKMSEMNPIYSATFPMEAGDLIAKIEEMRK